MKTILWITLMMIGSLSAQKRGMDAQIQVAGYNLYFSKSETSISEIREYVESGLKLVSGFFDKEFKRPINIYVFPSRDQLDIAWQTAWNMPNFKSQCWMVGSGVESRLDLLSPDVWDTEACEHDPDDDEELRKLIFHELTHILHSDYNRSPSFSEINTIDWFVEGLATYASGQLDAERLIPVIKYVKASGGPKELSAFWKGEHKYGLSGSLVYCIDKKYGRDVLTSLLEFNDVNDILKSLGTSEEELISNWKSELIGPM